MPIDRSQTEAWKAMQEARGISPAAMPQLPLFGGGGGGTYGGMEERVSRLETHFEYVRRDLDEIRDGQAKILDSLSALPTKGELSSFRWQWVATAVGAIALIVGGIIGGLSWIKPDDKPAQVQPVVIAVPQAAPTRVAP